MNALFDIFEVHKAAYQAQYIPADVARACAKVGANIPADDMTAFTRRAVARVAELSNTSANQFDTGLKQASVLVFASLMGGNRKTPPIAAQLIASRIREIQPALEEA